MVLLFYTAALISFVGGQFFRITLDNGLVIQLSDILVGIAVVSWVVYELLNKKLLKDLHHPYTNTLGLFVGIGVISLLFNLGKFSMPEIIVSALYLVRWLVYASIFYVVKGFTPKQKKVVVAMYLITSLVLVLIGYIQYFLYPNLRNLYYLQWDDHLFRMFSTLLDPNFAAVIFCLILFSLLPFIFQPSVPTIQKARLGAFFILTFCALLLTYSRSGYLMFFVGSTVSLWLLDKRKLILLAFLLLFFGVIFVPKTPGSAGVELWRVASIVARSEAAKQATQVFLDNPVFGVGFNTYRYTQRQYGWSGKNWAVSHSDGGTDNSFLFVLATMGIAGLTAFFYMWYAILRRVYNTYTRNKDYHYNKNLSIVILSSLAGLCIDTLFINSAFYPYVLFLLWTMIGMLG